MLRRGDRLSWAKPDFDNVVFTRAPGIRPLDTVAPANERGGAMAERWDTRAENMRATTKQSGTFLSCKLLVSLEIAAPVGDANAINRLKEGPLIFLALFCRLAFETRPASKGVVPGRQAWLQHFGATSNPDTRVLDVTET